MKHKDDKKFCDVVLCVDYDSNDVFFEKARFSDAMNADVVLDDTKYLVTDSGIATKFVTNLEDLDDIYVFNIHVGVTMATVGDLDKLNSLLMKARERREETKRMSKMMYKKTI